MAKPFYSMDEVCERLGKTVDEIRGLVREGKLREFRDAGKVFFRAEDVDKLGGGPPTPSKEDSGEIMLEAADDDALPTLSDSSGGTSVIGLAPSEEGDKPATKEDTVITASGIGVFDEDEVEIDADPMAKTQITTGPVSDQVSLEGTGSGSGLLDLTREADDTSLGAELLDEIYPGEEEAAAPQRAAPAVRAPVAAAPPPRDEEMEAPAEEPQESYTAPSVVTTTVVTVADPLEGLFSGLLVGALIVLVVASSVVASMLQGFVPQYALLLSNYFWFFLGGAVLLPVITLLIGWVLGKPAAPRRAA